tara:strand:+ start:17488 stop:18333 length:846 start_codon:yes stop_codon:yes gene_type:complete
MKKIIVSLTLIFVVNFSFSQCVPNSIYQDSSYSIWPDTIENLPIAIPGVFYEAILDIKTPSTLLEATGGDSSILYLDTVIFGQQVNQFLGNWPVDSMELVSASGFPTGIVFGCENSCVIPGSTLTCAYLNGTTNDPLGVYPIVLEINVYTHGIVDLGLLQLPYSTDLYSALGYYENLPGYKIIVDNSANSFELISSSEYKLFQNTPNPSNGNSEIVFYAPNQTEIEFFILDIYGRKILSEIILPNKGLNTIKISEDLSNGIYTYQISSKDKQLSKRMVISN